MGLKLHLQETTEFVWPMLAIVTDNEDDYSYKVVLFSTLLWLQRHALL
jgi:hypothetical protein